MPDINKLCYKPVSIKTAWNSDPYGNFTGNPSIVHCFRKKAHKGPCSVQFSLFSLEPSSLRIHVEWGSERYPLNGNRIPAIHGRGRCRSQVKITRLTGNDHSIMCQHTEEHAVHERVGHDKENNVFWQISWGS